jgi:AcrR family transcriptional regulator
MSREVSRATRAERVRQASRQRREQEKQELRQLILKTAAELFVERGYENFSLRQVAERIGYSATTIYLYFKDKDDLLFTLVDDAFARFTQDITAAAASTDDPAERLIALGRAYIAFGLDNPVYYQLMFMQRSDFLMGYRAGEDQPRRASLLGLQHAVQEAIDAGVLRPGDAVTYGDTLWALVHGIVALAISIPFLDPVRVQRAADMALEMIYEGLRRR